MSLFNMRTSHQNELNNYVCNKTETIWERSSYRLNAHIEHVYVSLKNIYMHNSLFLNVGILQ